MMSVVELAATLAKLLIALLGHEGAKRELDAQAVKLANEAADLAEKAKFGPW